MSEAKIYMIPCPIIEEGKDTIPSATLAVLHQLDCFVVERARTARRYIKSTGHPMAISDLDIFELDKNNPENGLYAFLATAKTGKSIGVLSEAGCPGIADPGALAVSWAHKNNLEVVPLVGPSSILLALIASGFNGQQFSFNGYLPVKKPELSSRLKQLENLVQRHGQTQIFMETPYRNHGMVETILKTLNPQLKLCIAVDISAPEEYIRTKTIAQWKNEELSIHKRPAIFLLGK